MTKTRWRDRNSEFWFGLLQTFSAVALLTIAIWGLFFSEFSELVEDELRASLALSKMDAVELRQEKTALTAEVETARATLNEIQTGLEEARRERTLFLNDLRNERFDPFADRVRSRMRWAEQNIENAESFPEYMKWIAPLLRGEEIDGEKGADRNIYWIAPLLPLHMHRISWLTMDIEDAERNRRAHKFMEDSFRRQIHRPMQNPTTGERIARPPDTGLKLLKKVKEKRYLGHLRQEDTRILFAAIDEFILRNSSILGRPFSFIISSQNVRAEEIANQARIARQNLDAFKGVFREFETLILEFSLGTD